MLRRYVKRRNRRRFVCPSCLREFWLSLSEADREAGRFVEEAEICPFCGVTIECPGIARDERCYVVG